MQRKTLIIAGGLGALVLVLLFVASRRGGATVPATDGVLSGVGGTGASGGGFGTATTPPQPSTVENAGASGGGFGTATRTPQPSTAAAFSSAARKVAEGVKSIIPSTTKPIAGGGVRTIKIPRVLPDDGFGIGDLDIGDIKVADNPALNWRAPAVKTVGGL